MGKSLVFFGLLICILAFLAQGLAFIDANSQTFDEAAHVAAGYCYIAKGDFRLNVEHPPLSKELAGLAVYFRYHLPFDPKPELWEKADEWMIGRDFLYRSSVSGEEILRVARLPNLFLGAVLVGLIGWWSYRLWGAWPAILAAGLAAFDPNLIAHAGLVTTDLPITFFIFLTVYLLWEFQIRPTSVRLVAVGIACGLTLATKFTGLLVLIIIGLLFLLQIYSQGKAEERSDFSARLPGLLPPFRRIVLIALLVVPVFYFIYGFPAWAQGIRYQLGRSESGDPHFYFLGELTTRGSLAYLPVAFLIKTPVGTLLMLASSLLLWGVACFRGPRSSGLVRPPVDGAANAWHPICDRRTALFLLVPPVVYFVAMAATRVNLGLRYILPVYPFLFVWAARAGAIGFTHTLTSTVARLGTIAALGLTAVFSLMIAPHQLAYFNELVGGPDQGHRYLSDSNLDWGQDLKGLKTFMDREGIPVIYLSYFGTAPPSDWGIRYQYLPGWVENIQDPDLKERVPESSRQFLAISIVNLQGIYFGNQSNRYQWLQEYRKPLTTIGHSIYVYDLTDDANAHLHLAEIYDELEFRSFADFERKKARALSDK
jgi:hypothetical protein